MNGEMYQICSIAAAAKKALREETSIIYTLAQYENRIEFQFLPEKRIFGPKSIKVDSVGAWFDHCRKKGLSDIKMMVPVQVKDRNILGFSNTTQSALICFFKNSQVSFFTSQWEFDAVQKGWNILYTEQKWETLPQGKPRFEDNTEKSKAVLNDIEHLARAIDCDGFAGIFHDARSILEGTPLPDSHGTLQSGPCTIPLPQIPDSRLPLFQAASTADVFGAMGSWNDTPPCMAHEKGMDEEYEALSSELLTQIRLAVLYAVNEWDDEGRRE